MSETHSIITQPEGGIDSPTAANEPSIRDWSDFRAQATYVWTICLAISRDPRAPVWQPIRIMRARRFALPHATGQNLAQVHAEFMRESAYAWACYPGFMGGSRRRHASGMVAEMLAGGLNANLGRDQCRSSRTASDGMVREILDSLRTRVDCSSRTSMRT